MANQQTCSRASWLAILAAAPFALHASHLIAATTTYTGPWAGGTIAEGDTVVLNNGASVTGNVVANGTLQFNQSKPNLLVISSTISGTGALSLTNTGTLRLTGAGAGSGPIFMGLSTTVSAGLLQIGSGNGQLIVGAGSGRGGVLNVAGGSVSNADCFLAYSEDSFGTASVSSGDWANSGLLFVGYEGTGTLDIADGSVTSGGGVLASELGSVGTATVSSGTWANSGDLAVGRDGSGTLNVIGGSVFNRDGTVGTYPFGVGTATVSSGTWANSGSLTVGLSGTGTLNVTGGSLTSVQGILGSQLGSVGAAMVSSGTWTHSSDLVVGGGGSGTLMVTGGNVTNVDGALGYNAGSNGTATVSSGTWANGGYLVVGVFGVGTLGVTGGSVAATDGVLGFNAGSNGTATVSSGTWANSGSLTVGLSGTGTLTMSGGLVIVGGNLWKGVNGTIKLDPGGRLQIGTGGTTGSLETDLTNNGTLVFNRSDSSSCPFVISGTGTITNAGTGTTTLTGATSYAAPLAATAGRLVVGDSSSVAGFATVSSLAASSGATLELRSRGLASVNGLSTLAGGTILASNGISLGAGANVVGAGRISGFVTAVQGSRIEADGGKLTVGDTGSYIGFSSDGLLYTTAHEVELLDRNLAVLGSLTQLGNGASGGSLRAANGMLLEQGKNLIGRGTVYGNFVNQGDVYGDGPTAGQQIVFAAGSTVSGNGSFSNVLFNGTYAPGNSPAVTSLQDGGFSTSSTLLIELGGTQVGSQYDQVQDSGILSLLGGTLNVVLTNSFTPSPGDSFQILRYGQLAGDFGTVNLPVFDNGLGWQRVTTGTAMTLAAIPSAVRIDVAAGSKTLAAVGYSSLVYASSLNKSGDGVLVLNGPSALTGPTTIQQGTVQLTHSSALAESTISPLAGGVLSLTPGLQATVGGLNPNVGGLVDVGTGLVTVADGLTSMALVTALQTGRAGGSWTGSAGITSSAAASSSGTRTVGWLDNGDGSVTFAYAAPGDTNLDWSVDILDVGNLLAMGRFDTGLPATWIEGDFGYDGVVDILDVADFFATGLYDAGNYNSAAGSIAAVPEPSVLGLAGVGAGVAGLLGMRRRRAA